MILKCVFILPRFKHDVPKYDTLASKKSIRARRSNLQCALLKWGDKAFILEVSFHILREKKCYPENWRRPWTEDPYCGPPDTVSKLHPFVQSCLSTTIHLFHQLSIKYRVPGHRGFSIAEALL